MFSILFSYIFGWGDVFPYIGRFHYKCLKIIIWNSQKRLGFTTSWSTVGTTETFSSWLDTPYNRQAKCSLPLVPCSSYCAFLFGRLLHQPIIYQAATATEFEGWPKKENGVRGMANIFDFGKHKVHLIYYVVISVLALIWWGSIACLLLPSHLEALFSFYCLTLHGSQMKPWKWVSTPSETRILYLVHTWKVACIRVVDSICKLAKTTTFALRHYVETKIMFSDIWKEKYFCEIALIPTHNRTQHSAILLRKGISFQT